MSPRGILYGIGVGPGASDLLTLRALRLLRETPVIAVPRSASGRPSAAWKVVEEHLADRAPFEKLELTFPMTKESDVIREAVELASSEVADRLLEGRSVAFLTEGDPSVYSTFGYLRRRVQQRWPELAIEVVPGITSITAVAALGETPLVDGQERVAIVPATYGVEDLVELLQRFDTVVLMKIGGQIPTILEALERTGMSDHALFVSKATMADELVERRIEKLIGQHCGCFSMMIVKHSERSFSLIGESPVGSSLSVAEGAR